MPAHECGMVRLSLHLVARHSERRSLAAAFRTIMLQAVSDAGCISCQLSSDLGDPDVLRYVERWTSETQLRDQIQSKRFDTLIALMEASAEPPRLEIELVTRSYGLEYVHAVRRHEAL